MKKIVALVLAMVMVLGLATTAFAVNYGDAEYETLYTAKTDAIADEVYYYAASEYVPGAENYLAHIVDPADGQLYFVGAKALYVAGGKKADVGMGKKVASETDLVYNFEAKTFGAQKWSCHTDGVVADYTYVDADGLTHYANKAKGAEPTTYLLVAGKVVAAVEVMPIPGMHILAAKDGEPEEIGVGVYEAYCVACKQNVKISYTNISDAGYLYLLPDNLNAFLNAVPGDQEAALPAGYEFIYGPYYVVGETTSAGANGSTVESAKTFDAGIAMYVGMSVMAAAGSAVVLKKKD